MIAHAQCGRSNRQLFAMQRHVDARMHAQQHALTAAPLFPRDLVRHRGSNGASRDGRRNCSRLRHCGLRERDFQCV